MRPIENPSLRARFDPNPGLINRPNRGTPIGPNHTVPYGTVPFLHGSQAMNCLATIIYPFGIVLGTSGTNWKTGLRPAGAVSFVAGDRALALDHKRLNEPAPQIGRRRIDYPPQILAAQPGPGNPGL